MWGPRTTRLEVIRHHIGLMATKLLGLAQDTSAALYRMAVWLCKRIMMTIQMCKRKAASYSAKLLNQPICFADKL